MDNFLFRKKKKKKERNSQGYVFIQRIKGKKKLPSLCVCVFSWILILSNAFILLNDLHNLFECS